MQCFWGRRLASAALFILLAGPLSAQRPTAQQAERLLQTRPDLAAQVRQRIITSGLTPDQIRARLLAMEANPESSALVASDAEGRIQGWVHVYGRRHVESDGSAEIGGLVVDPASRGLGIGRALMGAAESRGPHP